MKVSTRSNQENQKSMEDLIDLNILMNYQIDIKDKLTLGGKLIKVFYF